MAKKRSMARAKGRQGPRDGERYALMPVEVLQSEACRTLPAAQLRVLVALAAQFTGYNNGRLTLPLSAARAFGIGSNDTLNRGLHELMDRGLIQLTKQGGLPPFGCSTYALCWRQLDDPGGHHLMRKPTSDGWKTWRCAESSKKRRPPIRNIDVPTASPNIGGD